MTIGGFINLDSNIFQIDSSEYKFQNDWLYKNEKTSQWFFSSWELNTAKILEFRSSQMSAKFVSTNYSAPFALTHTFVLHPESDAVSFLGSTRLCACICCARCLCVTPCVICIYQRCRRESACRAHSTCWKSPSAHHHTSCAVLNRLCNMHTCATITRTRASTVCIKVFAFAARASEECMRFRRRNDRGLQPAHKHAQYVCMCARVRHFIYAHTWRFACADLICFARRTHTTRP